MLPLTYKRVSPSLSLSKRESLRLPYTKESAMKSAIYTPKLLPQKRVSLSFLVIYNRDSLSSLYTRVAYKSCDPGDYKKRRGQVYIASTCSLVNCGRAVLYFLIFSCTSKDWLTK